MCSIHYQIINNRLDDLGLITTQDQMDIHTGTPCTHTRTYLTSKKYISGRVEISLNRLTNSALLSRPLWQSFFRESSYGEASKLKHTHFWLQIHNTTLYTWPLQGTTYIVVKVYGRVTYFYHHFMYDFVAVLTLAPS